MMTPRQEAMNWWNGLSSLEKTRLCDTRMELVGHHRRWESLTGREIELIYNGKERPYYECPTCGDNMEQILDEGMDSETTDGSIIEYYQCNECGHSEEQVIKFD
jgi:predicted nucleic acid-binding Zn ribbon protein